MLDASVVTGGVIQTLTGLLVSTGFLLTLFVGFLVVAGFSKFRKINRSSLVHRNLVDRMNNQDGSVEYLPPDAPRGGVDQLRTPELLEQSGNSDS
jgi:hypothetical protein|tara:strand:- start:385 stop:669 length:285 start_codon:yes stop_codon:yes gene_type:complete